MKNKILTAVSVIMILVPWTILPLRAYFEWALEYAHVMIPCYTIIMIFSAIFTLISYLKAKAQNNLMKVCLVVNSMYGVFAIGAIVMIITQKFM